MEKQSCEKIRRVDEEEFWPNLLILRVLIWESQTELWTLTRPFSCRLAAVMCRWWQTVQLLPVFLGINVGNYQLSSDSYSARHLPGHAPPPGPLHPPAGPVRVGVQQETTRLHPAAAAAVFLTWKRKISADDSLHVRIFLTKTDTDSCLFTVSVALLCVSLRLFKQLLSHTHSHTHTHTSC